MARNIIELDDLPRAPVASAVVPATVMAYQPTMAETQQGWAVANGYAPARPYFALGTKLIDVGEGALRASRAQVDALPGVSEGLGALAREVDRENRKDFTVRLRDLRMNPDGSMQRFDVDKNTWGPRIPIEEKAFRSLLTHTPETAYGTSGYLADCPAALRHDHVNHWLQHAPENHQVKLRARNGTGPGRIWACVGATYGEIDVNRLARSLETVLPATAKVETFYDGYRSRISAYWHDRTLNEGVYGVGQFSKAGIQISTADDGTGSVKVNGVLFETLCVNLTTVPIERVFGRTVHRGKVRGENGHLAGKIHEHVRQAVKSIEPFIAAWTEAERAQIISDSEAGKTAAEVFGRLVSRGLLEAPVGCKNTDFVEKLVKAYDWGRANGGQTYGSKASVVRAVTRTAHTEAWRSPWATDTLQEQAGQLVYVQQWGV
jgi:hypothetical protein